MKSRIGGAILLIITLMPLLLFLYGCANPENDLREAAGKGDVTRVKELLSAGINVSAKGPEGATPLVAAVRGGHVEVVKLLLDSGAGFDAPEGPPPLVAAIDNKRTDVALLLLSRGASPTSQDAGGRTPLMAALRLRDDNLIRTLLDKGAKTDHKDQQGVTPLMIACETGDLKLVRLVFESQSSELLPKVRERLRKGHFQKAAVAEIRDAQANDGRTILMMAASLGHQEIVDYLLSEYLRYGTPDEPFALGLDAKDELGRTAADFARASGHEQVARTIESRFVDGRWEGKTTQGGNLSFTVKGGRLEGGFSAVLSNTSLSANVKAEPKESNLFAIGPGIALTPLVRNLDTQWWGSRDVSFGVFRILLTKEEVLLSAENPFIGGKSREYRIVVFGRALPNGTAAGTIWDDRVDDVPVQWMATRAVGK